jgi:hypothetical protein
MKVGGDCFSDGVSSQRSYMGFGVMPPRNVSDNYKLEK